MNLHLHIYILLEVRFFNTVVRQKALNMGYTLNEHGLCYMTKNGKGDKLTNIFQMKNLF